jgi:hypothetical protein
MTKRKISKRTSGARGPTKTKKKHTSKPDEMGFIDVTEEWLRHLGPVPSRRPR